MHSGWQHHSAGQNAEPPRRRVLRSFLRDSTNTLVLLSALGIQLLLGCGPDGRLVEVQDLRKSGEAQAARERAVEYLREDPSRMSMWPEFIRCSIEAARYVERRGEDPTAYLFQASLAAGAMNRESRENLSKEWQTVGNLVLTEMIRQINQITTEMRTQTRSAEYFTSVRKMEGRDDSGGMKLLQAMDKVDAYRRDGRDLLYRETVIEMLMNSLPEPSEGTVAQLLNQVILTRSEWIQALELNADYTRPILDRAQGNVNSAMEKAQGDLRELGYFLAATIFENGI